MPKVKRAVPFVRPVSLLVTLSHSYFLLVPARGKSQQLHETSTLPKVVGDRTLRC